jgi:hypothetical protein
MVSAFIQKLVGDEFKLPFHGLVVLVVSIAPFAKLLEMFRFPIGFAASEIETVEKSLGLGDILPTGERYRYADVFAVMKTIWHQGLQLA